MLARDCDTRFRESVGNLRRTRIGAAKREAAQRVLGENALLSPSASYRDAERSAPSAMAHSSQKGRVPV